MWGLWGSFFLILENPKKIKEFVWVSQLWESKFEQCEWSFFNKKVNLFLSQLLYRIKRELDRTGRK
jgi:hypothetical protein